METIFKKMSDSRTQNVQILFQGNLNGSKRLFGGKLMEWIDIVAAVCAKRHSGKNVTTLLVDSLIFKKSAYANDTIVLDAFISHTGTTSMEVTVKTYVENLNGKREEINTAYLVMVALDDNDKPTKVPSILAQTDEEKMILQEGEKRYILRKKKTKEKVF